MKRTASFFRAAATALLFAGAMTASLAQDITKEVKEEVLAKMSELVTKNAFVPGKDFSKWPEFLEAQREKIDKTSDADDFANEVRIALEKFGISHIVLMPPKAVDARMDQAIVGIGVSLRPEDEGFRVWNVFAKAPAGEAGIEIGDLIVGVDGVKPKDIRPIAGPEGTQVVISVLKSNGTKKDYTITRRKFSTVRPETLTWVGKDTAVLKIYTFDRGYGAANLEKLVKQALPAKNLVIDLRGNGGGAVMNMLHFLSMVLPEGTEIGTFVTKTTVRNYKDETNGDVNDLKAIASWAPNKTKASKSNTAPSYRGKIAVLVDAGSGSASEISAAALKDTLGAPVVGTKSAGAVLASVMAPLPHKFLLQFPITDYVTIKGVRLEGNGVTPDLVVPSLAKPNEPDLAVEKAISLLKGADIKSLQAGIKGN